MQITVVIGGLRDTLPKLCKNGCNRIAVGKVITIEGAKMTTYFFCSICRKQFLKGKREKPAYNHNLSELTDTNSGSDKNMG